MSGTLSPQQVEWLQETFGISADAFVTPVGADGPIGVNVPTGQVGQVLQGLGAQGRTQFTPNNMTGAGPRVRVPMHADGTPTQVLEVGAGGTPTDLGLPPDPNLVHVERTDLGRPELPDFDATQPPPPEMVGQFDAAFINNPRGYVPNLDHVADTLRPGGNIIAQGNAPYNPDFTNMLNQVPPVDGPPGPTGLTTIDNVTMAPPAGPSTVVPKPADVMGGPFYRTEGQPIRWPNQRVVATRQPSGATTPDGPSDAGPDGGSDAAGQPDPSMEPGAEARSGTGPEAPDLTATPTPGDPVPYLLGDQPPPGQVQVRPGDGSPVADPLAQTQEVPAVETPPGSSSSGAPDTGSGANDAAGAEAAEAGLGGAAEAGALGGAIAGGMALYDDVGKVRSGQMSVGDAAVDVGGKTAEVGGLTMGGKMLADAAGAGASDVAASAAASGGDALAGAAGDAAGAGLGAAGAGGVIGGVVAGGMALIDDIGKVEDGTMTGGHATVDVTAKTAVGVGAGVAGAAAGAEIGAAVGSIIPGAGTVIGLVAGAVVGGAVGYVGNALMNTETGKAILNAAGDAVDAAVDGVEAAGEAIGDAASAVGGAVSSAASAVGDAAGAAVDAAGKAASEVEDAASSAVSAVGDAASSAASAVGDAAGAAVDAAGKAASEVEDAASSAVSAVGDAASSAASAVGDAASSAASAVSDAAGSAFDAVKGLF